MPGEADIIGKIMDKAPNLLQTGFGIYQSIKGAKQAHKAQDALEGMVNGYKSNTGIVDYYNKALQRYNVNPYNSAMYRMQTQNANRNLVTGINAMQDRRGALASVGNLVSATNDANLKAVAAAEGQQGQALNQLGHASQVKAAEDYKPFEMKYNLLSAKAQAGSQMQNAGMQNISGGLQGASNMMMADKMYGNGGGRRTNLFDMDNYRTAMSSGV